MKRLAVFVVTLALASVCWGQSPMSSQKTPLPNNGWATPTVESSFNHCSPANELQFCWIAPPGNFVWINANAGLIMAVDSSCVVWEYNEMPQNSWTKHQEFGCVKEITRNSDGNYYALEHYVSGGQGYALSKWSGSAWNDVSCCFQSMSMAGALMVAYDINGTIWVSKNYGASPYHQAWCDPDGVSAIAAQGFDANGNPDFYVACSTTKIWEFRGTAWSQLPGAATAIATNNGGGIGPYIIGTNGDVEHYNGSGWDDIVSPKPVTSLAVGGQFNVWAVGAKTSSGTNVYRFWEKGVLVSHGYAGSVACGQGVPQAECETFTHTLSHKICFGSNCGPVSTSQWHGNGSWGPNANVFVRPQDAFSCINQGDCGAVENEGEMSCNGGGSNLDGSPGSAIQFEWAYTKLEATEAPACGFDYDIVYTCNYPVTSGCDNTLTPNFNPTSINVATSTPSQTENLLSFDSSSFCWDVEHTGWHCLSGATGSADVAYTTFTYSNQCTDTAP